MKFVAIFVFVTVVSVVLAVPVPTATPQDLEIQFGHMEMICKQHTKRGNCRALIPRWTYDHKRGVCLEFKYGGCGGNSNNFESKSECEFVCKGFRL